MRYHLIGRGRIVASDTAPTYLEAIAQPWQKVVGDEEWRDRHFLGALRRYAPRRSGAYMQELLADRTRRYSLNVRSER